MSLYCIPYNTYIYIYAIYIYCTYIYILYVYIYVILYYLCILICMYINMYVYQSNGDSTIHLHSCRAIACTQVFGCLGRYQQRLSPSPWENGGIVFIYIYIPLLKMAMLGIMETLLGFWYGCCHHKSLSNFMVNLGCSLWWKKKQHLTICWESLHSNHQLVGDGTSGEMEISPRWKSNGQSAAHWSSLVAGCFAVFW